MFIYIACLDCAMISQALFILKLSANPWEPREPLGTLRNPWEDLAEFPNALPRSDGGQNPEWQARLEGAMAMVVPVARTGDV